VGEININCAGFTCADAVFQRNHAPDRWVTQAVHPSQGVKAHPLYYKP
jgi:hypothetical protein